MNIAIFTNNYLPNPYGITTSVESFRKEFEKKGHKVFIFAPHSPGYVDKNKNVFRYPSLDIKYKIKFPLPIPYSSEIDKKINDLKIDIIHSQHPNLLGNVALRWAKKKNIPIVFTWHTLYNKYTHYVPLIPTAWAARWIINASVKYANRADKIIVPTESVGKIVERWGVKNGNLVAIATGVDAEFFKKKKDICIRERLAIDADKKIILSISRLTEEKNILFLMDTMIKVLKNNPNFVFILGGEGYLKDSLVELINIHHLGEQVFLTGLIGRDEIVDYFKVADIFIYASKSETQGVIVAEAMYMGLPIVAVNSVGINDLLKNAETGVLVNNDKHKFAQAIVDLTNDETRSSNLGKNAAKEAREKYTNDVCADKMIDIYKELIASKKQA